MPVPTDETLCETRPLVVVDTPRETTPELGICGCDGEEEGGKGDHKEL